ncbi:uncharacterized protein VTP21DRAFT_1909 [Calcarisporiella thermophila]|uniref:uncharacterized protein n=1 Tax=Calcarisporiella thermophila TaxID=911321 RepID=UPI003742C0F0
MSLLDDFIEQSQAQSTQYRSTIEEDNYLENGGFASSDPIMLETGYVSTGFTVDEDRVFALDRVQFQFPSPLATMAVSNNKMIMALESFHILRIDLNQAHEVEDIELPRKPSDGKIRRIFFDPTGRHLIISTDTGENFYLYEKWKKAKPLARLKGIVINCVAWNKARGRGTEASTHEILIGSTQGHIYETEIEPTDEFFKREDKYVKQVYVMPESDPITGLHFEQFPVESRKYLVIATTATRIYQFIGIVGSSTEGGAIFENLFAQHDINPGFQELPGDLSHSELHFFNEYQDIQYQGVAKNFAWLTGPGIYHGDLVFGSQSAGDSVIDNAQLLPYPGTSQDEFSTDPSYAADGPLSLALTKFHFILLYKDRVRAICRLNDQLTYEELIPLDPGHHVKHMTVDTAKNTFWIYTNASIYELIVSKEDRDVWKIYLQMKQYDMAREYCKNAAQMDIVVTTRANDYFSQGRYLLSADYYAQSTVAFEEVALKFVERHEMDPLRMFLLKKLERLKKEDRLQKTLLATWLVEIYMNKMNLLEDLVNVGDGVVENFKAEQEVLEDEFKSFLQTYKSNLDRKTTYKLIGGHGRTAQLLFYASLIGDYDKVISHYVQVSDYEKALEILSKHGTTDLHYKFAPVLMEKVPYDTVSVWMRTPNLNPRHLIPALLKYDHSQHPDLDANQAIRYLSYVVTHQNNTDPVVHNFLVTLYATQPSSDESGLLQYLAQEGREGKYELDYALRVCSQHGRIQSCIRIYGQMGLYEEAVELALKCHDLELARINADKPEDDPSLRKKLWLQIARHVIEEKKNVKEAMSVLKQCDLLTIDDILPFFPDFVVIDDLKGEICAALEEYNQRIEDLKAEMDEATKSAENIRVDIRELRSRFAIIHPAENCVICSLPLLSRQFYIFPCQHAFHADCLVGQVKRHLTSRQVRRLVELQEQLARELLPNHKSSASGAESHYRRLASVTTGAVGGLKNMIFPEQSAGGGEDDAGVAVVSRMDQLKEEIDDVVAGECLLCGEVMIRSIDQPFIAEEERELVASWVI